MTPKQVVTMSFPASGTLADAAPASRTGAAKPVPVLRVGRHDPCCYLSLFLRARLHWVHFHRMASGGSMPQALQAFVQALFDAEVH